MPINGTIINYYIHCKRQCYMHYNRINMEDESELVKIGKAMHEEKKTDEITVENIKVDKIKKDYLIEIKKSDADIEAAKMQVLYYLLKLKEKGIDKKGKIEVIEKNKSSRKSYEIELTAENEAYIKNIIEEIEKLVEQDELPPVEKNNKCKKCAYYSYCYI